MGRQAIGGPSPGWGGHTARPVPFLYGVWKF
jgi:hypothetical protein